MTDAELDQALADAAMFDVVLADANAAIGVDRLVLKLVEEVRRLRSELREAHAHLTGKGEVGWCLTHDAAETELGKAAAALNEKVMRLEAEVRRLKRGEFTPDEFQALCHHRDETPGCTRAAFEAGCREYQEKLFGPKPKCDDTPALTAAEYRVLHDEPHPSHVWNASILTCCVRCGEFRSSRHAWFACNAAKLAGKVEFCCECAGEYPASDLIAGEIYCPTCRRADGAPCASTPSS